jgi:CRP-like cAMP-binding protein
MSDEKERCTFRHLKRHQHLAHEGEHQPAIFLIEEGWACRYRVLRDGSRQINALFLPGEYCEPQWLLNRRATYPVVALTDLKVMAIPLTDERTERTESILQSLSQMFERQADWMVCLARKTALERLSVLFCELFDRLHASNKVVDNRCPMPLTQHDLADITGLTPVHVNRVLQSLRSQGLMELDSRWLRLPDVEALRSIGAQVPRVRESFLLGARDRNDQALVD